jgi:hypothetical protein
VSRSTIWRLKKKLISTSKKSAVLDEEA